MFTKKALAASVSAAPAVYVEDVFSTWLYTGNSSTQTITNGIDLAGEGGLVWVKSRSNTVDHRLYDTDRGATKLLASNSTQAEELDTNSLTGFNSDGFSVDNDAYVNGNNYTYASWTFRKAAKFFDVVTYTGNGSTQNVAHNLGSVPGCMIVKASSGTTGWYVYHRSLATPSTDNLVLNETGAADTGRATWNNTAPTSTQFSVSASATGTNANGVTYVAYLFAHDAGGFGDSGNDSVVSCGTYTTDASGNATVTLGWEPQWVLVKRTNSAENWIIGDIMRGAAVGLNAQLGLRPNTSNTETNFGVGWAYLSATQFSAFGSGSSTYIYIAIRRGPMKTPTDATKVFEVLTRTGTGSATTVGTSVLADFGVNSRLGAGASGGVAYARVPGAEFIEFAYTFAAASAAIAWDTMKGIKYTGTFQNGSSISYVNYHFRRAPGFFDVVAYTGTSAVLNVSHNLGVAPEMMICRQRGTLSPRNWWVYHSGIGNTKYLVLNTTAATATLTGAWNDTTPTSSVFTLGSSSTVNQTSQPQIAYLFATCPGVSKVGSYTGTGTTLSVDCGFTSGARFVLIKRTDSTGDWYAWDTARGIVSGDDPYLLIAANAAEVTNTDYIDPLSSGFQISSTAPAAINANGGSFVFLAIA
jgi:hypothetical protein